MVALPEPDALVALPDRSLDEHEVEEPLIPREDFNELAETRFPR